MKNRIKIKLTAITLAICMLLSGSLMPIWAADSLTKESTATESTVQESIISAEDTALEQADLLAKEDEALWKFIDRESPNAEKHTARLEALEEPDTFVFQNSDGTRTVYFMEEDVKYTDSNGLTVIKDISLTKANNGFGITRNDVDLLIPDKLTSGVDISLADYSVKLIPQNTATNALAEQKNNSVVYNGVFGEKTALVYTPVLSGIKEDIILSEYTEDASYTFILKTNGLMLRNRDGKYCLFSLSKKDPVFYLGEILVYDSIGKPDMGSMTVETIEEGQEYLLTVTASDEFLSDPDTVYPVTIDPSISSSDSTASGAIEDAVIFQNRPTENFGNYVYNRVGTPSSSYGVGRTVVRLRGLLDSDVWAELHPYNVESLYFYATEATGSGSQTIMIYPLFNNTTWTETGVTWNDIGNVGWYTSYDATMSYNQEAAFNITSFATQWKYGDLPAEAGFIMLNSNESLDKSFCSSECSNSTMRPRVVMTYTPMEGGNGFANATSLTSGDYVTANLTSATDKRYFKFVPSATGFYTIESRENFGDPYVRLYNTQQQTIKYDNNSAGYSNFRLTYHFVKDATYYFQMGCTSSGVGLFTFSLSSANNLSDISTSAMVSDGLYYIQNPAVSYSTFYTFTPALSREYLFYSYDANTDPMMWLYSSNLSLIDFNDNSAGNNNFRLSANLTAGQTYYIVAGHIGTGTSLYYMRVLMEATIPTDSYYLMNITSKLYLDIHGPNAQEYLHQYGFHTEGQAKWTFNKGSDGYYTIRSDYGNMYYVGVSGTTVGNNNIKLFSSIYTNTQWKIYAHSSGELLLEPRSAKGMLLYAPDKLQGTELQLVYMSSNDYKSQWKFEVKSSTSLEGQQMSNWCWATSARMLVNHYYDVPDNRDQSSAVAAVYGAAINSGGTHIDAIEAANYYKSGDTSNNELNLIGDFGYRFSQTTLRKFINDGHVIYIARGWYPDGVSRAGGHASTIVGYTTIYTGGTLNYRYFVYDPYPIIEPEPWTSPTETIGQVRIKSYEWISNGRNGQYDDGSPDNGIWDRYVVITTTYSSEVIARAYN